MFPQKPTIPSPLLFLWRYTLTHQTTPAYLPSHSPTLGHWTFTGAKASSLIDTQHSHILLHIWLEPCIPRNVLLGLWYILWGLVGWYCCSSYGVANAFNSFSPFSKSSIGDPVISSMVSIHLWICQALAEPLRRQLYQASVSMHFLASTIVPWFGDCIWDASPGGAVSGWPFL